MAKKPFYSMEEVCERLGKSEDEIKAMVRSGDLREFRDAGKVFFRVEDIDRLAGDAPEEETDDLSDISIEPTLEPGGDDSDDEVPTLTESSGGTSIIGLEPLDDEVKEGDEEKEGTAITSQGVGVFDDEELDDADPMAKTQITTGADEDDQITLEGAGSGSGLLDLAREADDTALGADLLDEIYPGEEDATPAPEEPATAEPEEEPEAEEEAEAEAPEYEEAADAGEAVVTRIVVTADPSEGVFSGLMISGLVVMALASSVVAGALQGYLPDYGRLLTDGMNFYFFLGGAALLAVIGLLAGWFVGRAFAGRR